QMVRLQPKRRPNRSRLFLCRGPTRSRSALVTGTGLLSAETAAKRLELLLQLLPKTTSIGYLRNPSNPVYAEAETREVQVAARAHGVRLVIANASRPSEIETAFADLVQQRADALQVSSGAGSSRYSAVPKWEEAGMLTNQTSAK